MDIVTVCILVVTLWAISLIYAHHRGWMSGFDRAKQIWRDRR